MTESGLCNTSETEFEDRGLQEPWMKAIATYEGRVLVGIRDSGDIDAAVALIRQAHSVACA
jgi:hypothetical protein